VNKNAKSVTNGLRLAGGMELIKMASEFMIKVNDGAGVKGGIDGFAAYGFRSLPKHVLRSSQRHPRVATHLEQKL
jgi:hypothetical protein